MTLMTLTNRLTVYFLIALALVLGAFSLALYSLAWSHLSGQVDERARSSLDTLVAAAEVERDGLEWDRRERTLWPTRSAEPPVWAVFDAERQPVDGDPESVGFLGALPIAEIAPEDVPVTRSWQGTLWRVYCRGISHVDPGIVEQRAKPGQPRNPSEERYQTLQFMVAAPLEPMNAMLRTLAFTLFGVSTGVWLAAAMGSRWVCRRALAPLTKMSAVVKAVDTADLAARLPVPNTHDELGDLAKAFNGLLERLQEAFERQSRFTSEASHQLRTPLTAMLGQLEVALRRDREGPEYRRVLSSAMGQARRLSHIVEALLFLARADADAQFPGLEEVDLVAWLPQHLHEVWAAHPRFEDILLERDSEVVTRKISCQPTLLGQALDNLIDNALKYSASGSPVLLRFGHGVKEMILEVADKGQGIAPSDVVRVMTPFFRTEEARRRGISGLGLGLAVAERIVKGFGGRIVVESELGHGSRFRVVLPLG